jgi:hypothetical protein
MLQELKWGDHGGHVTTHSPKILSDTFVELFAVCSTLHYVVLNARTMFGQSDDRRRVTKPLNLKVGCSHPVACIRSGSGDSV